MSVEQNREITAAELQDAKDHLEAVQQGPEAVLLTMEGRDSPDAIRWRLQALLDLDRASDAADLIRSREAHGQWADLATYSLAANGEPDTARQFLGRANEVADDLGTRRRNTLAYARGRLRSIKQASCPLGNRAPEQSKDLEEVVSTLEPITAVAQANREIENELESVAVQVALEANGMLGNRGQSSRLASLLASRKPIPMMLAHAVLQRWVDPAEDLPHRLREEHPGSFEASLAAAVIEGEHLGKSEPGFESALELTQSASTPGSKVPVSNMCSCMETSWNAGGAHHDKGYKRCSWFISRCSCDCSTCEHTMKDGLPGLFGNCGKDVLGRVRVGHVLYRKRARPLRAVPGVSVRCTEGQSPEDIHVLEAWNEKGCDAWQRDKDKPVVEEKDVH